MKMNEIKAEICRKLTAANVTFFGDYARAMNGGS
jgi:hypothetical protein